SVLGGEPLLAESGDLSRHVRQIALEPRDQALVAEGLSVTRKDQGEIEFLERVERGNPLIEKRVTHVRGLALHQVAGANDPLLRQIHDRVAPGVAAPKKKNLDLALALLE